MTKFVFVNDFKPLQRLKGGCSGDNAVSRSIPHIDPFSDIY